jgi:hypothetical protein
MEASIATGINYNTLRADISFFSQKGFIEKRGRFLRLKRLSKEVLRWSHFFSSELPALEFCNSVKKSIFYSSLYKQAYREADKIIDKSTRIKFLQAVRNSNIFLGVNLGINCSLSTLGRYFGKSKATAFRYVKSLEKSNLLKVKRNYRILETQLSFDLIRKSDELRNRCFLDVNGNIIERLPNSYKF